MNNASYNPPGYIDEFGQNHTWSMYENSVEHRVNGTLHSIQSLEGFLDYGIPAIMRNQVSLNQINKAQATAAAMPKLWNVSDLSGEICNHCGFAIEGHHPICKAAEQPVECSYEVPFRRADHVEAMSEIIRICKKAMNKVVGEPWVALDKINRLASRQLLLMKTPMEDE